MSYIIYVRKLGKIGYIFKVEKVIEKGKGWEAGKLGGWEGWKRGGIRLKAWKLGSLEG